MVLPLGDLAPTRITPAATYGLIALNIIVFLVQLELGDRFTVAYAATPVEITRGKDIHHVVEVDAPEEPDDGKRTIEHVPIPFPVWFTLLSAMFLHGNPLHLAGNMLYLWIFGDNVEETLGFTRFVIAYLLCGIVGSMFQILAAPDSPIPTLGASGAIAGVMGMYVVWYPANRVRVLVIRVITEWPAIVVIGGWILLQVAYGIGSAKMAGKSGGVAYLAHVGGAFAGIVTAVLFRDRARAVIASRDRRWIDEP